MTEDIHYLLFPASPALGDLGIKNAMLGTGAALRQEQQPDRASEQPRQQPARLPPAVQREVRQGEPVVDRSRPTGRRVLTDETAVSSSRDLPVFLARPEGAPVYHGFPLLAESLTDGWWLGVITAFDDDPDGCDFGDAYVVAPDGSRAGLVWAVGDFETHEVCPPTADRWGVYAIACPRVVRCAADLLELFTAVLPELKAIHARVRNATG